MCSPITTSPGPGGRPTLTIGGNAPLWATKAVGLGRGRTGRASHLDGTIVAHQHGAGADGLGAGIVDERLHHGVPIQLAIL